MSDRSLPGGLFEFFRILNDAREVSIAAVATALVLLVTDPIAFIRIYILEGLLVIAVETAIRGFFGFLGQISAELQLAVGQLWNATGGTILGIGGSVLSDVIEPAIVLIQSTVLVALSSLGIAAPFAAAISIVVTLLVVVVVTTLLFELLRWALPVDAIVQPIASAAQGIRAAAATLPLVGSRGDS